jgi:hypothetical protein
MNAMTETTETIEARGKVRQMISAVRTFTDDVERIGAEEFAAEAAKLADAELAWVIDRLDDVRQAVGEVLEKLSEEVVQNDPSKAGTWNETLSDLENAGEGLYAVMNEIDPDSDRHWIIDLEQ